MVPKRHGIELWWLALIAGLLPLLTIHTTFVVSALEGHINWCVPYWESCTSISKTGRHGSAYFLFKGTMLPAALLGIMLWWLNGAWLRQLGCRARGPAWLPWLGLVAGVSLGAYTLALGHGGDTFNLIRRVGVVLYFALTFINQLLLSAALKDHVTWGESGRRLLWLCQLTLFIGVFSVILDGVAPGFHERLEDAFEWVLALLINLHALWVALLWRRSVFVARLWTG